MQIKNKKTKKSYHGDRHQFITALRVGTLLFAVHILATTTTAVIVAFATIFCVTAERGEGRTT